MRAWGGYTLGRAASQALTKIEAVLPADRRGEAAWTPVFSPDLGADLATGLALDQFRAAIHRREVVAFAYTRENGEQSFRSVRPLGLFFWGARWTLCAWCETRADFRNFRIDRTADIRVLERQFEETKKTALKTYLKRIGAPRDLLPGA